MTSARTVHSCATVIWGSHHDLTDPHRSRSPIRWWRSSSISPRVTRIWEPHVTRLLRCNIWHVRGSHRDLLVDTGLGVAPLRSAFPELFDREPIVVATHAHHDHVGGLHEFHERRGHRLGVGTGRRTTRGVAPGTDLSPDEFRHLVEVGYEVPEIFVDAVPDARYDVQSYQAVAAPLTDWWMPGT